MENSASFIVLESFDANSTQNNSIFGRYSLDQEDVSAFIITELANISRVFDLGTEFINEFVANGSHCRNQSQMQSITETVALNVKLRAVEEEKKALLADNMQLREAIIHLQDNEAQNARYKADRLEIYLQVAGWLNQSKPDNIQSEEEISHWIKETLESAVRTIAEKELKWQKEKKSLLMKFSEFKDVNESGMKSLLNKLCESEQSIQDLTSQLTQLNSDYVAAKESCERYQKQIEEQEHQIRLLLEKLDELEKVGQQLKTHESQDVQNPVQSKDNVVTTQMNEQKLSVQDIHSQEGIRSIDSPGNIQPLAIEINSDQDLKTEKTQKVSSTKFLKQKENQIQCPWCKRTFPAFKSLNDHIDEGCSGK